MDPPLTDLIYECAFVPELWPQALDRLATLADAVGGHLIASDRDVLRWTASEFLCRGMERISRTDLLRTGERVTRLAGARHAGFLTEHDLYRDGEIVNDPTYSDFLLPLGLGCAAGTAIELPTGTTLLFTVERLSRRGPVEPPVIRQLDALRPHLARSALMSARLKLERARAATETLALIGLPALVFTTNGKVISANRMIEEMTEHIAWRMQDRVAFKNRNANALLQKATATLAAEPERPVLSFAVRGKLNDASLVAHVIPIRRSARDIFVQCAAVLVLTPVSMPQAPSIELVQSLFDLTPAEARVARHLATGNTLDEIAATGRVSRNTIRTHVRGVLEKTGCRRQAEVVALLGGIAVSPLLAAER
jgi:DNA-binding CsgD family transcriptional regulator